MNLSKLAREYTNDALDTLVEVIQSSQSDSARIAAIAILDRGYGRPTKTTSLEVNAPLLLRKYSWWHTQVLDLSNDDFARLGFEVSPMFLRSDFV